MEMFTFSTKVLTIVNFALLMTIAVTISFADELPGDFPPFEILTVNNPAPGVMLFSARGQGYGGYLVMSDSVGNVLKYKKMPSNTSNFAVQANGLILYNTIVNAHFKAYSEARIYIADTSLTVLDSIVSGNGFIPTPHSSEILPNGNYLYSSFEAYHVDMSQVVENGNPNAIVAGAILVEMDLNKNVVFQWRSWDYIDIVDTYQPINDFLNIITLYSNFNSVAVAPDGNYLICNRLLSEIVKVNRANGEIIWRLGGKHNQFNFTNESHEYAPVFFSMQHDIRLLPNGNITLFDNGEQYQPPLSRVVEYQLDEVAMTARKVWEYKPLVPIFAASNASAQRLPNGNTLIGWGNTANNEIKRDITEVNSNGVINFDMTFPKSVTAFKALKFPYPIGKESALVLKDEILPLNTYKFENDKVSTGVSLVFSEIEGFMYNWINLYKYDYAPVFPKFEGEIPNVAPYRFVIDEYNFDAFSCTIRINTSDLKALDTGSTYSVYIRDTVGSGYFRKLETGFDGRSGELIVQTNSFGEFMLAKSYKMVTPPQPFMTTPRNGERVLNDKPVKFSWSPKGYFRHSAIVVAEDANFENIVIEEEGLTETSLVTDILKANKEYYWKVAVTNDLEQGPWSETYSFTTSDAYLNLITPIGGEVWSKDTSRQFIRWDKNIDEPVKIELMRDDVVVASVTDSLLSYTGAFAWIVDDEIEPDSTYRIRVTNLKNPQLTTISDNVFKIIDPTTSIESLPSFSALIISNSPNPFNASTTFEFTTEISGIATISIYNLYGQIGDVIYSNFVEPGSYSFDWDSEGFVSGMYLYKITVGNQSKTGKMVIKK
jgi:hypothetical protein